MIKKRNGRKEVLDITKIQNIAHTTWPITYGKILSKEQLDYMLGLFYSHEALAKQIENLLR